MFLSFDNIKIKKNLLINAGSINLPNTGIVTLEGNNGVGKTTFLKYVFLKYSDKHKVIYIDQNNDLINENWCIIDNIAMSLCSNRKAEVTDFLKNNGLSYLLDLVPKKMSGGEKRLVLLLRGLLSDASIVLIDEPTNDLDRNSVKKIIELINFFSKNKLFIIVSHDSNMKSISQARILIDEKKVIVDSLGDSNNDINNIVLSDENASNISILPKAKKSMMIYLINMLYFIMIFFIIVLLSNSTTKKSYYYLKDKQLNIYLINSEDYNPNEVVPSYAFSFCASSNVNFENMLSLEKQLKKAKNQSVSYGLNLESCKDYNVYPIVFYDKFSREKYNVLDEYMRVYYGYEMDKYNLDCDNLFFEVEESTKTIPIEEDKLREVENIYWQKEGKNGEQLEIQFMIVVFNDGYSINDFMETIEFKNLENNNYFLKTNETILFRKNINLLKSIIECFSDFAFFSFSYIILNIISVLITLISKKCVIKTYIYYGIDFELVKCNIKKRINNRYVNMLIGLLILIPSFVVFGFSDNKQIYYIIPFLYLIIISLAYSFDCKIIDSYVNRWKRYDCR